MTAILGVFGEAAQDADLAERMLAAMRARGTVPGGTWRAPGVLLAVASHAWEDELLPGRTRRLAQEGDLTVVADAAIYYRDDLRRALRGAGPALSDESPAACVAAALRAWGLDAASRLEGDFAFIGWDAAARRVTCARDFAGKRPLVYAAVGSSLVVASTAPGVLAHPRVPHELDLVALAEVAAGIVGMSGRTGYRAVRALPSGTLLVREGDSPAREVRYWSPPAIAESDHRDMDEAAEELRGLLAAAVRERLAPSGTSTVWMSGGWDSTAVFAAGRHALGGARGGNALLPVSISYPEGDPGREDELIDRVAQHWQVPVRWLDIADIPLFDRPAARAAARDEPFAHTYELWCRSLAGGTRAAGSRVALDGVGGDQLFQVSNVYLADLLRRGQWLALAREWRAKGLAGKGRRAFYRWVVRPALPEGVWRTAARLGGRELPSHLERPVPPWIVPEFAREHGLARQVFVANPPGGLAPSAREMHWYLSNPYFPFVFGQVTSIAHDEGVELRSPLYDGRVVAFAARRPRAERSSGTETKRLLRAAMRGLLPDAVLAPRTRRTGVTGGYFRRAMREQLPAVAEEVLSGSVLRELGIVDAERLGSATERYLRTGDENLGVLLTLTLHAELWVRSRCDGCGGVGSLAGKARKEVFAAGGQAGRASHRATGSATH